MWYVYLCEEHVKWSKHFENNRVFQFGTIRASLWRFEAEFLCSLFEDDGFVCFFHGEREQECCEGDEDHAPLAPLPCLVLGHEASNDGTGDVSIISVMKIWISCLPKSWSSKRRSKEHTRCDRALTRRKQISV